MASRQALAQACPGRPGLPPLLPVEVSDVLIDAIKQMVADSTSPLVQVRGSKDDFRFPAEVMPELLEALTTTIPDGWVLTSEDRRRHEGYDAMETALDLVLWAEVELRARLRERWGRRAISAGDTVLKLESLLRGALLECYMGHRLSATIFPTLQEQFALLMTDLSELGESTLDELDAYYAAQSARRIVLLLAPLVLGLDGRTVAEYMDLRFPEQVWTIGLDWSRLYRGLVDDASYWFYNSPMGKGLFLVTYTRKCSFGLCTGCCLSQMGSEEFVGPRDVMEQCRRVFELELSDAEKEETRELVLSNNGSVLDTNSFPLASLLYCCVQASHHLSGLKRIVLETRVEFITEEFLALLKDVLNQQPQNVQLELAVGVEIFNDHLRNTIYRKGLTAKRLRTLAYQLAKHKVGLRTYFMYRPLPEMTVDEAQGDIRAAAIFLDGLASDLGLQVTFHLNPTFVAANTPLAEAFSQGKYVPVRLTEVVELVAELQKTSLRVYVGLNDEGLAVPGGSFVGEGEEHLLDRLRQFNRTQDVGRLAPQPR
jgi:radical SAM enzyme (TIGR01210 family)